MFVVVVEFVVAPEHAASFLEAVRVQAGNSLALEDDCHVFEVCTRPDDPTGVLLYEKYSSPESFELHLRSAHFQQFDALVAPWVVHKSVQVWMTVDV